MCRANGLLSNYIGGLTDYWARVRVRGLIQPVSLIVQCIIKCNPNCVFGVWFLLVGIHPTTISDSFQKAAAKSAEILEAMSTGVQLTDRESLLQSANTALSSKVIIIIITPTISNAP